jgi:hypothetical protein
LQLRLEIVLQDLAVHSLLGFTLVVFVSAGGIIFNITFCFDVVGVDIFVGVPSKSSVINIAVFLELEFSFFLFGIFFILFYLICFFLVTSTLILKQEG